MAERGSGSRAVRVVGRVTGRLLLALAALVVGFVALAWTAADVDSSTVQPLGIALAVSSALAAAALAATAVLPPSATRRWVVVVALLVGIVPSVVALAT